MFRVYSAGDVNVFRLAESGYLTQRPLDYSCPRDQVQQLGQLTPRLGQAGSLPYSLPVVVTEHGPPGVFVFRDKNFSRVTVQVSDETQQFFPFGVRSSNFSVHIEVKISGQRAYATGMVQQLPLLAPGTVLLLRNISISFKHPRFYNFSGRVLVLDDAEVQAVLEAYLESRNDAMKAMMALNRRATTVRGMDVDDSRAATAQTSSFTNAASFAATEAPKRVFVEYTPREVDLLSRLLPWRNRVLPTALDSACALYGRVRGVYRVRNDLQVDLDYCSLGSSTGFCLSKGDNAAAPATTDIMTFTGGELATGEKQTYTSMPVTAGVKRPRDQGAVRPRKLVIRCKHPNHALWLIRRLAVGVCIRAVSQTPLCRLGEEDEVHAGSDHISGAPSVGADGLLLTTPGTVREELFVEPFPPRSAQSSKSSIVSSKESVGTRRPSLDGTPSPPWRLVAFPCSANEPQFPRDSGGWSTGFFEYSRAEFLGGGCADVYCLETPSGQRELPRVFEEFGNDTLVVLAAWRLFAASSSSAGEALSGDVEMRDSSSGNETTGEKGPGTVEQGEDEDAPEEEDSSDEGGDYGDSSEEENPPNSIVVIAESVVDILQLNHGHLRSMWEPGAEAWLGRKLAKVSGPGAVAVRNVLRTAVLPGLGTVRGFPLHRTIITDSLDDTVVPEPGP